MKMTNPPVVILSNWSPERVYHKAIEKDPTALDSILTRLLVVEIKEGEPLDIDGFKEAIAQASLVTTVTPTTLEVAEDSTVRTFTREEELVLGNSTTEIQDLTTESPIYTPPMSPTTQETQLSPQPSQLLPVEGTPPPGYQINEEELIPCVEQEVTREETNYERFQRERREKIRKQHIERESAIDKIARKGNKILFTGYN